ncbi:MAG: hypothetical protein ABIR24_10195 [Verrucomicrobiota bacterium]
MQTLPAVRDSVSIGTPPCEWSRSEQRRTHLQKINADFRPRKMRPDGAWQIFLCDPDGHFIELFIGP